MKPSLGNLLLAWLMGGILFVSCLSAQEFTYAFHIDKPKPYLKEAVLLTLEINQSNPDIVLLIDFDLVKSDNYTFERVDIQEKDTHHALSITYTYLLYPLRTGLIDINTKLIQKVTSDDSIAYSFSGDRDNVRGLVTQNKAIPLTPLSLEVKALEKETLLVGDFQLHYQLSTHQAKAYEPIPFHFTIQGEGYPPLLENIFPKAIAFNYFSEVPKIKSVTHLSGTHNTAEYTMALSHHRDFNLSQLAFKAFNPKTQEYYTLRIPAQHFGIDAIEKQDLLNKDNYPPLISSDWSWIKTFLGYLLVFASGYLLASWRRKVKKSQHKVAHPLREKIKKATDAKALLRILLAHPQQPFAQSITKLEALLYEDAKISLTQLKKEAMESIE